MDDPADARVPVDDGDCRDRFRAAAERAGRQVEADAIAVPGLEGIELTIDVAHLGAGRPSRALLVVTGVHGVEGIATSPSPGPRSTDGRTRRCPTTPGS